MGDGASFTVQHLALVNGVAAQDGGAIQAGSDVAITLRSVVAINNSAPIGSGGAVYLQGGNLTVSDSRFEDNQAFQFGAAASCFSLCGPRDCCVMTVANSTMDRNAVGKGGGALGNSGPLRVLGCTLRNNSAPSWGGGALMNYGETVVRDSVLDGNLAVGGGAWGGAINVNGDITLVRALSAGGPLSHRAPLLFAEDEL